MPPLLVRCESNLNRTVPDDRWRNAETIREEILSAFQLLFTDDASEGALDYYECRFALAFKTLRINHVRAAISDRKGLTELPDLITDDGETMLDENALARLSRVAQIGPSQEDEVYLPQVLKAVDDLPPDERRAFVLRRVIGYTEEETAARCHVEGRTIRYRLARADKRLKKLKEDL
jgi:hypothetical protein